jgi:hypothetical protein
MNRANRVVPDSKGDRSKIARNRNVSANSASVKNKAVAANRAAVAAKRVAASKADDKKILSDQERREVTPAAFFTSTYFSRYFSRTMLSRIRSSFFCATGFSHFAVLFGQHT